MSQSITLQTYDTMMSSGNLLGQFQFAAPYESDGGAAVEIAARVYVQAEGTYTAVKNPTSMVFATAGDDVNEALARIKIDQFGNFIPSGNNVYSIGTNENRFLGVHANSGSFIHDLGIGTDDPQTRLDVSGVITATSGNSILWNEAYDIAVYASGHGGGGGGSEEEIQYVSGIAVYASGQSEINQDGITYVSGLVLSASGVDGTGSANQVAFWSDSNTITGENNLYWDSASNYLGINQASPEVTLHMTGEDAQTAQIRMEQYNNSADAPDVRTRRYRGTAASPAAIQSGDYLYRSNHEYYNGTSLIVGGQFAFDNTNNANRTQFTIAVTTDGTSVEASTNDDVQFKIDGNDSGAITFNDAYKFPTIDGSVNQVLKTNGAGTLSWADDATGIDGTGIANYVPKWVDSDSLTSGIIYDDGTNVGIGTASPATRIDVAGTGTLDYIQFDSSITDTDQPTAGMSWNDNAGTIDIGINGGHTMHIGQDVYYRVQNQTGSTIYQGQAVYYDGVIGGGDRMLVDKFVADASIQEARFLGLATEEISNGSTGFIQHFGHIKGVDLRTSNTNVNPDGETWSEGDILFAHPTTAGGLTKNEPRDAIYVAVVLRSGNNGQLFVRPKDNGHISDLHDIDITGLNDNNFLVWNSGADYWQPSTNLTFADNTLHLSGSGYFVQGIATSGNVYAPSIGAGVDNSVVVLNSAGYLKTDEIDSRVWGSTLADDSDISIINLDIDSVSGIAVQNTLDIAYVSGVTDGANVYGTGVANYLPKWSSSTEIVESNIYDDGTYIGIFRNDPAKALDVTGTIRGSGLEIDSVRIEDDTVSIGGVINGKLVLKPAGTGPLQTNTTGNARGSYAVDLQRSRTNDDQVAGGNYSFIGNGQSNKASATGSSVVAGYGNSVFGSALYGFIGGGSGNYVHTNSSSVVGGVDNLASGSFASVVGGSQNAASGSSYGFIGNGYRNYIRGSYSTALNGANNLIAGQFATTVGGENNINSGDYSVILGGANNSDNNYDNVFILGSNITAVRANSTYVENLSVENAFYDSSDSSGSSGQVLRSTVNGTQWDDIQDATYSSGIATYASGQAIQNQESIQYMSGIFAPTYKNIDTDSTIQQTDSTVFVDSTASPINVYIPSAVGIGGKDIKIKRVAGQNIVEIVASGSQTIDGSHSYVMNHLYESTTITSNNSNWFIT